MINNFKSTQLHFSGFVTGVELETLLCEAVEAAVSLARVILHFQTMLSTNNTTTRHKNIQIPSPVRLCVGISRFITFLHLANVLILHDLQQANEAEWSLARKLWGYSVYAFVYHALMYYLCFCGCLVRPSGSDSPPKCHICSLIKKTAHFYL